MNRRITLEQEIKTRQMTFFQSLFGEYNNVNVQKPVRNFTHIN